MTDFQKIDRFRFFVREHGLDDECFEFYQWLLDNFCKAAGVSAEQRLAAHMQMMPEWGREDA